MNIYQIELQKLRPQDEIQDIYFDQKTKGYGFISTASHGFLVVPKGDPNYNTARKIAEYGYIGKTAIFLEEDCEAGEFINLIN